MMDFGCVGGSVEQHVVDTTGDTVSNSGASTRRQTSIPTVSDLNPLCGCVKDSNFEDEEILDQSVLPDLSILIDASEDEVDELKGLKGTLLLVEDNEAPVKKALDTIQQTLDDLIIPDATVHEFSAGVNTSTRVLALSDLMPEQTPTSQANQLSMFGNSPSPTLLNPLTTDWKDSDRLSRLTVRTNVNNTMKTLLCPTLDTSTSTSLASLLLRMEEGFRVRLTGGPISCLAGEDEVLLYLHPDHSRLCVESATSKQIGGEDEKKQQETVDFWIELPVSDILRLESNKSLKSFSIVLEKETDCLVYYDFETPNAIDREVLVSTIMIVLDQTHNSQRNIDWTGGGTLDQPIPCSPSLEQPILTLSPSLEHPEALSPGAHKQLSPSKRTQIFNSADRETETSLVIHLEDLTSTDQSDYWGNTRNYIGGIRDLPVAGVQGKSSFDSAEIIVVDDADEIPLDFKPSASSQHLATAASSSQLAAAAWCGGNDLCTLALRDIADTCTGIFAMKQAVGDKVPNSNHVGSEQLPLIEEFIAAALGAPASVYSYFAEGDIWNIEISASTQQNNNSSETAKGQKDGNNSFLCNRASLLNAQAARLRTLRNEMTFAAALKQSKERMQFVQTVRSFDDAYYSRKGSSHKLIAATEAADRFHASPLLKSVVESMTMHDRNGNTREVVSIEDVEYYDSDPEDIRPRTTQSKAPRRAVADRMNETSIDDGKAGWRQQALAGTGFDEIITTKKLSKKLDEEVIVEIVHAMTNERFTLMWHPTQNDEDSNLKPICAKVWIESGVYLSDGTFLLPKLTWCRAAQEDQTKTLEKLDLLDICRIGPSRKINRNQHPFAVTHKSFFIETQRDLFVFQAQSSEERDRIVYGFKLVVARLASLLMLRDIRAAEEFFGAMANMVPGEAPAWTRGKLLGADPPGNSVSSAL